MKKSRSYLKHLISLVCIVCLCSCLFTLHAAADVSCSFTGQQGQYCRFPDVDTEGMIIYTSAEYGRVPSGMTVSEYDTFFVIEGTPTESGTFHWGIQVQYEDDSWDNVAVTIVISPPSTPAPTVIPTVAPTIKPSTAPSVKPSAAPVVNITKHPTGEYVVEGENAMFISRADNATGHVWRIVSQDTKTTIEAQNAPASFPGLTVAGADTDSLILGNIPLSMDGWSVEAKFFGNGGPVFSRGAVIHVSKAELKAPSISAEPQDLDLEEGASSTLSFTAKSNDQGQLRYQWYSNTSPSTEGGSKMNGSNSTRFRPPVKEGIMYYYAAVWTIDGDMTSPVVYTRPAAVTYIMKPKPSPSPSPSTAPIPAETARPQEEDDAVSIEEEEEKGGISTAGIAIIVVGVLLLAAIICVTLIFMKRRPAPPAAEPEDNEYHGLHDGIDDEQDYENYKNKK